MPNPDPVARATDSDMQKPFAWFAEAYPFIDGKKKDAKRRHEKEFLILQKAINAIAKSNVSGDVKH